MDTFSKEHFYPACACASKGLCDRSWCLLYIYIYICKDFFLSFKILTFRCPFQHRKASLRIQSPSVYLSSSRSLRVQCKSCYSAVWVQGQHRQKHNIYQIETTPLRYCMLATVEHAYSRLYYYTLALGLIGSVCHPTIFRLSTRGSKLRLDLSLVLRQHSGSTFLCCSISLHLKRSMGNC